MGKNVLVYFYRYRYALILLMIFMPIQSNVAHVSPSKRKSIEIGAFHESAAQRTHKLRKTDKRKAWQNKNKNNEFSIVHFDYNCHETVFKIGLVLVVFRAVTVALPSMASGKRRRNNETYTNRMFLRLKKA